MMATQESTPGAKPAQTVLLRDMIEEAEREGAWDRLRRRDSFFLAAMIVMAHSTAPQTMTPDEARALFLKRALELADAAMEFVDFQRDLDKEPPKAVEAE